MRIAIFDPAAGISGDMTLGALLALGVPATWLEELPGRLGVGNVRVTIRDARRSGITCKQVEFAIPDGPEGHGRHVGELIKLVQRAPVSDWVKERATRAFQLVGEAEGRVHGVAPEKVHLHEVGAGDAVLDIVGAIEGFERLGVEHVYHLPVAVGNGWVEAAHGRLPIPAPATAILLEGLEIAPRGPVEGEATTPTGAALLRVLSEGAPPERWRIAGSGWGGVAVYRLGRNESRVCGAVAPGARHGRRARRADVAGADEKGASGISRRGHGARGAGGRGHSGAVPPQHNGRGAALGGGARDVAAPSADGATRWRRGAGEGAGRRSGGSTDQAGVR